MAKGKYILGAGILACWYLFASRHNGKPAIVENGAPAIKRDQPKATNGFGTANLVM